MADVNAFTFGVEFETTIPRNLLTPGRYRSTSDSCDAVQPHFLPAGWIAKSDCSIRTTSSSRIGCEFVSPVLQGADGLRQVMEAIDALERVGAKVNASCGMHVHVGGFTRDEKTVEKICTVVAYNEKAIFASTGTKSRENGSWCGSIKRHGNMDGVNRNRGNRYHVLNLCRYERFGTVEFRAFGGTLNKVKAAGYIRLCLALVEQAENSARKTKWNAKPASEKSPVRRKGDGQTAMARLFYQIGWTKGRTKHVHGNVEPEGTPDLKSIKKEMMRLAKKYDAQLQPSY